MYVYSIQSAKLAFCMRAAPVVTASRDVECFGRDGVFERGRDEFKEIRHILASILKLTYHAIGRANAQRVVLGATD